MNENEMAKVVALIAKIVNIEPEKVVTKLNKLEEDNDTETIKMVGDALNNFASDNNKEEAIKVLNTVFKGSEMFKKGGKLYYLVNKFNK